MSRIALSTDVCRPKCILVMSENTIVGEHRNADVDMDRLLAEVAGQRLEVTGS